MPKLGLGYTKAEGSLFTSGGRGVHVSLDMFFDLPGIIAKMDKKTERVLSSTGAFAMSVMQRGMRYRKSASKPGDYPSARQGRVKKKSDLKPGEMNGNSLLRAKIRFGFESSTKSLIVGPALLDSTDSEVAAAGKTVPELINFGGTIQRRQIYDPKTKQIRYLRRGQKPVRWRYRPRPFVELTKPIAIRKLAENMEKFKL